MVVADYLTVPEVYWRRKGGVMLVGGFFHIFLNNKSHEKTKTCHVLIRPLVISDFPTLSVAL